MGRDALFLSLGEHCVYDHDGNLCQLLQLSDRGILQETPLAETYLQAKEVHIPLHNGGGKMDQNGQGICPEPLQQKDYSPLLTLSQ